MIARSVNASVLPFRAHARTDHSICPELECLRSVLGSDILREASDRARQIGVTADRVLIDWGIIDDDAYVRRLAGHLGWGFEDFRKFGRDDCLLTDGQFRYALQSGLLPLRKKTRTVWIVAPRHTTTRDLNEQLAMRPLTGSEIRLTTTERFNEFVDRVARDPLAGHAVDALKQWHPNLSAAPRGDERPGIWTRLRAIVGPLAILSILLLSPLFQYTWASVLLSLAFLSFAALRIIGCCVPAATAPAQRRLEDHELPVYSVVAGLYKEAQSVGKLIGFLRALD